MLSDVIHTIEGIFKNIPNRYEAHKVSENVLIKMVKHKIILEEIIKRNLTDEEFIKQRGMFLSLELKIFNRGDFGMVANCFIPLPDSETSRSLYAIHHHQDVLLTTIGAYGSGYDSITFNKNFKVNAYTNKAQMTIKNAFKHKKEHISFVDSWSPHIVLFSNDLCITYALWSTDKRNPKRQIKRFGTLESSSKKKVKIVDALKNKAFETKQKFKLKIASLIYKFDDKNFYLS